MVSEKLVGFHDSELKRIEISPLPGQLELSFALPNGGRAEIRLYECSLFKVSEFVTQNVISRLHYCSGESIDTEFVKGKLEWVSSVSEGTSYLTTEVVEKTVLDIFAKRKALIYLEPSWGAEAVFVFESFYISC